MRLLSLLLFLFPFLISAQVPQAFEFQGIARDNSGNVLVSQSIGLRLSIIAGTPTGATEYQETQNATTTPFGLFTVQIGNGAVVTGVFSTVDWAAGAHYLKVEYDPAGGTNYIHMGTTQLLSVPYALVSGSSTNCFSVSFSGDTLYQGNGCYVIIPGISGANGGCADADGDGYFDQAGCGTALDCDDNNAGTNPGAMEFCDGADNNCDGVADEGDVCINCADGMQNGSETDVDCGGPDCAPCSAGAGCVTNSDCGPGLICQGGICVPNCPDADADGYTICDGDCDDANASVNPAASEFCDGIDNDCDGMVDEDFDFNTDPNNCGGCQLVCQPAPNTIVTCVSGTCMFICNAGFADCDGNMNNGCETNVSSDQNNCGGCGISCPAGTFCYNGQCVSQCPLAGQACDDGNPCTISDVEDGTCNCIGTPLNCDDGNPCTVDMCMNGICTFSPVPDGTACAGGSCQAGACTICSTADADADGFTECNGDCDDTNASIRPGAQEICNGVDDDCDGQIDEGFGTITCGTGACQNTVPACLNGVPQTCTINASSPEVCDGIDNDCDGSVDEGNVCSSACTNGIQDGSETGVDCGGGTCPPCGPGQGCIIDTDCGPGMICQGGACVQASCPPGMFDCDGQSFNGCEVNTQTDPQNCGGCGTLCSFPNAVAGCTNGICVITSCSAGYADCNGNIIDGCETYLLSDNANCGGCGLTCPNGFTCQNGQCVQGGCVDLDADGYTTCAGDCNDANAQINPGAFDQCDGIDNDCDGNVDDGLGTITCGTGACQVTIPACANGVPQNCTPGNSSPEVCDGIDNDCDGSVDEGGVCAAMCSDLVQNGQETGVDCGGPFCQPCGQGQGCLSNNDCGPGLICQFGTCVPGCPPAGTACDDGIACTINDVQDGACSCSGTPLVCNDGNPCTSDQCVNGICTFSLVPNGTPCAGGTCQSGTCTVGCPDADADGFTTCNGDCNDTNAQIRPGAMEVCNGVDDDCDGQIDEGFGTITCGTGACQTTISACMNGVPQSCTPGSPALEICDGIDNDCDGQIDEGFGTITCGTGACQTTIPACINGVPQNCTPGTPAMEICDGVDNDCDGQVDEGNPGGGGSCNTGLPGACALGTITCQNGSFVCVPNNSPSTEICDGIDNDCDGSVDEGGVCGPPNN